MPVHLEGASGYRLRDAEEQARRAAVLRALDAVAGCRRLAARLLGISLRTLHYYCGRMAMPRIGRAPSRETAEGRHARWQRIRLADARGESPRAA
jgi:hypothetical protein